MDNLKDKDQTAEDEKLAALLATCRCKEIPEADFESRFIADFHRRLEALQQQQPEPFMARVRNFFSAIWQNKTVYATSFAALCLLCVTYLAWTPAPTENQDSTAALNINPMPASFNAQVVTPAADAATTEAKEEEAKEDADSEDAEEQQPEDRN